MADEEQKYQEENGGDQQHQQQPLDDHLGGGEHDAGQEHKNDGEQREDVCRDFLKNICNRGSRCKFYHPPDSKARVEEHINFCIDYQVRLEL